MTLNGLEIDELDVLAPEGIDETQAWQITLRFTVKAGEDEQSLTGYAHLMRLREGDAISQLNATDVPTPFDSDLRNTLLQTLADRMTSATASK